MRTLCLLVLLLVPAVEARDKTYATGKLIGVTMSDIVFPLHVTQPCQNCASLELPVPLGVTYMFDIEQNDITYVAACTSKAKKSYAADWIIHDPVEYRTEKDKLFLKRPNGKELQLALVTRTRSIGQESTPQPVGSETGPQKHARLMIPDCR